MADRNSEAIAARLTPKQRQALMWLPASGRATAAVDVASKRVLGRLPNLVHGVGRTGLPGSYAYGLTQLGVAVRAIVEKETRDAG